MPNDPDLTHNYQRDIYAWLTSGGPLPRPKLPDGETMASMADLIDLAELEVRMLTAMHIQRRPHPAFHELYGGRADFVILDELPYDTGVDLKVNAEPRIPDWKHPIPSRNPTSAAPSMKTRAALRAKRKKR